MKRSVLFFTFVFIVLTSLALTAAVPAALLAQIDPTNQQQTNDAAVQQLFDQTATAVATSTAEAALNMTATADTAATRTVEAQFNRALTATAEMVMAPTQTVQAMFDRALTATAIGDVPNYADYELIDVEELDLLAAPARTAAHLSPDGTKFVHFQQEICIYELRGSSWRQDHCFETTEEIRNNNPGEMFWSPDGRYLTMPTYEIALITLRDTDVQVLDTETGTVISLTEDGAENNLMRAFTGNLDIALRWLDEDTLVFIRYGSIPTTDEDASMADRLMPPAIYSVDVPTDGVLNEPELLTAIPSPYTFSTYVLAVDARRGRAAFNFDTRNDAITQGLWQVDFAENDLELLIAIPESRSLPLQLDYSTDGRYLLTFNATPMGNFTMRTVSTETGEMIDIDPRFPTLDADGMPIEDMAAPTVFGAGWSPRGSALVYVVRDLTDDEDSVSGVYITSAPGVPGTRILEGNFYGTTCCQRMPIQWADNDIIMIGRGGERGVLLVEVG